jgi:outer membrane lipoprotein-sorting protein
MTASRIFLILSLCALPVLRADSLEEVLTRMDRTAKDFTSFSANWTHLDYQKILDDSTTTKSSVRMQRTKDGLTGVIVDEDGRTVYFEGRTAQIYTPKANNVDIYDLGKQANQLQQIILLGFGTRRADMEKTYSVMLGGPETVAGTHATRLDLTPKSKDLKNNVTLIQLWIPENEGYPIQEKILKPSQDYTLVTYSGMKMPALPNTSFKLTLPAGVHKNYPQK